MHALVFMLAAAYTLAEGGHVRVDVFYSRMSARQQAMGQPARHRTAADAFLLAICCGVSGTMSRLRWQIREGSQEAGGLPYPFPALVKSCIPARCGPAVAAGLRDAAGEHRAHAPAERPLAMPWVSFLMLFAAVVVVLLAGYPVAFTLAGTALLFAAWRRCRRVRQRVSDHPAQPRVRHHEQRHADRRAAVRVHGRDAGARPDRRRPAGDADRTVGPTARRPGHRGDRWLAC